MRFFRLGGQWESRNEKTAAIPSPFMKNIPNETPLATVPYVRDLESVTFCVLNELLNTEDPMARKICGTDGNEEQWAKRIQEAILEIHSALSLNFYSLRDNGSEDGEISVLGRICLLPILEDRENWERLPACQDERKMARFKDFAYKNLRFIETCMTVAEDFPNLQEMPEDWRNAAERVERTLSGQPDKNA